RRIQEKDETLSSLFRRNAELTQRVSALEEEVYSGANELNRTVREAQELRDRVQDLARELAVREEAAAQWEARAAQSENERNRLRAERDRLIENLPVAQVETLEPGARAAIDRLREDAARAQARERALAQALEHSEGALAGQSVRVRALESEILELQTQSAALHETLRRSQPASDRVPRERVAELED